MNAVGRPLGWHLFCRVIDNYGDAGIAWRLARQLRAAGDAVTLFIDDLAILARIEPRVAEDPERQLIDGIAIAAYATDVRQRPADVVVSIFGSTPSDAYRSLMASTTPSPVWIDLEYLSAESWVVEFHGLPSPDPRSSLVRYFFYPGFVEGTGGLCIEPDFARRRSAFVDDAEAVRSFSDRMGIAPGIRHASLFAYPSAPTGALFDAIASGDERWTVLVPHGVATDGLHRHFGGTEGPILSDRALTVRVHPFLSQDDYDRLLWSCEVAFVRGEDSFVRAQVAGLPFVWQPYPQAERTQDVKRRAFEDLYDFGMEGSADSAQRTMWRAWNEPGTDVAAAWSGWRSERAALEVHARRWGEALGSRPPLVVLLRDWVASRRADLLN